MSLAPHTSLLDSVKLSSGTRASLDVGDKSDDRLTVEWEVLSLYIFVCHAVLVVNLSCPWSKYMSGNILPSLTIRLWENLSTFVI